MVEGNDGGRHLALVEDEIAVARLGIRPERARVDAKHAVHLLNGSDVRVAIERPFTAELLRAGGKAR